jgi:sporulation protein YlmC with PRC-barrel domain
MKRSISIGSLAAGLCATLATAPIAAQVPAAGTMIAAAPAVAGTMSAASKPALYDAAVSQPAQVCLADLQAFNSQMQKGGYWLSGSGYGYPMAGFGYGYGYPIGGVSEGGVTAYQRPGSDVRTLLVAANILARQGEQQPCEDVLAAARADYKVYAADLHNGGAAAADIPDWQQQQIASAKPVTGADTSFRSDQLLGTDVLTPQNVTLGSVDDLVLSPQTGKIAYLVIARGGVFGIGQKYVPVPWADFRATPNASLMVLDTTKTAMDGAPQVRKTPTLRRRLSSPRKAPRWIPTGWRISQPPPLLQTADR